MRVLSCKDTLAHSWSKIVFVTQFYDNLQAKFRKKNQLIIDAEKKTLSLNNPRTLLHLVQFEELATISLHAFKNIWQKLSEI